MSNYIVYKDSKILRIGTCPPEMVDIQAGNGEKAKEGIADGPMFAIEVKK